MCLLLFDTRTIYLLFSILIIYYSLFIGCCCFLRASIYALTSEFINAYKYIFVIIYACWNLSIIGFSSLSFDHFYALCCLFSANSCTWMCHCYKAFHLYGRSKFVCFINEIVFYKGNMWIIFLFIFVPIVIWWVSNLIMG